MDAYALPIGDLTPELLSRWLELRDHGDRDVGPFLHPSFVRAVGRVQSDVEVGVIEEGGAVVGLLPFKRLPFDVGGPVGGRLCDLSGALLEPGVKCDPVELIGRWDLHMLRMPKVSTRDPLLGAITDSANRAPYIDLSRGFDAYRDGNLESGSRFYKQIRKRADKLERAHGPIEFEWHTDDPHVFDRLMTWKAAQRRATRTANVLELPWAQALLKVLREGRYEGVELVQSSLRVNGTLAAAHVGVRTQRVLHYWITGYNVDFAAWGPGLIILREVARAASDRGVRRIDLGPGEERFKMRAASGFLDFAMSTVTTSPALSSMMSMVDGVRDWSRTSPVGEPIRVTKRTVTRAVYAVRSAVGNGELTRDRPLERTKAF